MFRYATWFVNGALVTLCCFLVARTLNSVFAALLVPAPALIDTTEATAASRRPPSWTDREVIVTRNLFNASLLAPNPPPSPPEEELEETELPLGLLATISSATHPERGWAAIWDADSRERAVVEPGDEVSNGRATVLRIERRRLVLSENGVVRELVFDENGAYRPPKPARRPSLNRRAGRSRRARR